MSVYTAVEAAQAMGLSVRTVQRLAAEGHLPCAVRRPTRHGGWRIPVASVAVYLRHHNKETAA